MANRSVMRPGFFAGTYTVETGQRAVMRPGSYVIETVGSPPPGSGLPVQTDFVVNISRLMFRRGG